MARKILYSPGWGAGWSTWNHSIPQSFMCQYQPIIDALERGDTLTEQHPAVQELLRDCREQFNQDYVCLLGLDELSIAEVPDGCGVRIEEYDGYESVVTGYSDYF